MKPRSPRHAAILAVVQAVLALYFAHRSHAGDVYVALFFAWACGANGEVASPMNGTVTRSPSMSAATTQEGTP